MIRRRGKFNEKSKNEDAGEGEDEDDVAKNFGHCEIDIILISEGDI